MKLIRRSVAVPFYVAFGAAYISACLACLFAAGLECVASAIYGGK